MLTILRSQSATFISYAMDMLRHACCSMCMRSMQLVFVFLYHAVYCEPDRPRHPKSRMLEGWEKLWTLLEKLGTGILKATASYLATTQRSPQQRLRKATRSAKVRRRRLYTMTVLAMNVQATIASERYTPFDTDTAFVGIDNRCSGCISHDPSDFVGPLKPSGKVIKGFGGSRTTNVHMGTLGWTWEDDQGAKHTFTIPNSYYVPP
jgi:hypothetical protein